MYRKDLITTIIGRDVEVKCVMAKVNVRVYNEITRILSDRNSVIKHDFVDDRVQSAEGNNLNSRNESL